MRQCFVHRFEHHRFIAVTKDRSRSFDHDGLLDNMDKIMIRYHQATTEEDIKHVHELFLEYLHWVNEKLDELYSLSFDIESIVAHDMTELEIYFPPHGRLILATVGSEVAGIACSKRIRANIVEIKRMYVRPSFRGKGIGRGLLEYLIKEARAIGYPKLRLDSVRFMKAAHALYHSAGFQEIEAYPESEIPQEFHQHWVFMEKTL